MKIETEFPEQKIIETTFRCPKCNKLMLSCPGHKASASEGFMLWCTDCNEVAAHCVKKLQDAYEIILQKFPNGLFNPKNIKTKKVIKGSLEDILTQ